MASFRVITTNDGFKGLRSQWEQLADLHPRRRIFCRYDWCYWAWSIYHKTEHPKDELYIVVATRDGHEEVAILPFYIRNHVLGIIGDEISDVCDAVYPSHHENWHTFWKDVVKYIEELPFVQDVRLEKMEGDSELLSFFAVYFERSPATLERCATYSYFNTFPSGDLKEVFPQLDSKERSNLKNLNRRFPECDFKIISKAQGIDYPESALNDLLARMVQAGIREEHSGLGTCIKFMKPFYDAGRCEIAVIEKGNQLQLASYRLLEEGGYILFWVVLYMNPQMTTVTDVKYVLNRMQDGRHIFDYGTGAYSYKLGTFRPRIVHLYRFATRSASWGNFIGEAKKMFREFVKVPLKKILRELVVKLGWK